jgi:hypothetical protein
MCSKKLKTLKVCAVVLKKLDITGKILFSNFEAEAGVVDLKISKTRRTKVVCDDV